jgi:hypothetical protein
MRHWFPRTTRAHAADRELAACVIVGSEPATCVVGRRKLAACMTGRRMPTACLSGTGSVRARSRETAPCVVRPGKNRRKWRRNGSLRGFKPYTQPFRGFHHAWSRFVTGKATHSVNRSNCTRPSRKSNEQLGGTWEQKSANRYRSARSMHCPDRKGKDTNAPAWRRGGVTCGFTRSLAGYSSRLRVRRL